MDNERGEEESGISIWETIGLGILALVLIWIILAVFRYLQVMSYGSR